MAVYYSYIRKGLSIVSNDPRSPRQFAEVTFFSDYRHILEQANINTLILQCAQDSIVPSEVGDYLHKHLKNSDLCILEAKAISEVNSPFSLLMLDIDHFKRINDQILVKVGQALYCSKENGRSRVTHFNDLADS